MTYREVIAALKKLTPEQLDCDATVWVPEQDEYYPMTQILVSEETDILDKHHPFFVMPLEV